MREEIPSIVCVGNHSEWDQECLWRDIGECGLVAWWGGGVVRKQKRPKEGDGLTVSKMLLEGLDELDYIRTQSDKIAAHESSHPGTINTLQPNAPR